LDPKVDRVIEIGMILYSITNKTTLMQFSSLLPSIDNTNPAESINHISPDALNETRGLLPMVGLTLESEMIREADVIVAHNAEFDQSFFPIPKPWVCTKDDFLWPLAKPGSSLVNIALAHGIGVSSAHRALTDCQLIARLFDITSDLPAAFERAMRPKATFLSLAPFSDKDRVKAAGFVWKAETKQWLRSMAIEDAHELGFPVKQL
jgi:DNA polymerase-3 subunit epsilon